MIIVTRLNGSKFYINALLIETVEDTPDTIITLTTGKKFIVIENSSLAFSPSNVKDKLICTT